MNLSVTALWCLILRVGIVVGLSSLMGSAYAQRPPAAALGPGPFVYHTLGATFRVVVVTKGLVHPWGMAFLPDGSMLITERPGRLRIFRNGVLDPTPVSGVPAVYAAGLNGLLDIALDPGFSRNHFVYLSYNKPGRDLGPNDVPDRVRAPAAAMGPKGPGKTMIDAVARGVWNGHALTHVHDIFVSNTVVDDSIGLIAQDSGVRVVFGRDGKLYVGTGAPNTPANSGKYANSRGGAAQDPGSDDGKVLRLNDDGSIPRDNPFVGRSGYRPEIYTMGHRNILGMAVDPSSGVIWEAENGPQDDDKLIVLDKPGANFGWPIVGVGYDYSGDHIGGPVALGDPSAVSPGYLNGYLPGIAQPFLIWVPCIAPSGLAFYTADQFPKWKGNIFVGSLKYRRLERLVRNDGGGLVRREHLLEDLRQRIRDVRQGPDGDLYVLTDEEQGALLRIEPAEVQSGSEGVYTSAQALRGKSAYLQNCAGCHQADLSGHEQAPALTGDSFLAMWGRLGDLTDRIRATMPPTGAGSLGQGTYFDIVAYMLHMNGLPAGTVELKGTSHSLQVPIGN